MSSAAVWLRKLFESEGLYIAAGDIAGSVIENRLGNNPSVGTSFVPVTVGGIWRTPQSADATALRVKAGGDVDDAATGSGAREVTFVGLDETGALVTEAIATNGVSESNSTSITFMRLISVYVSAAGTYATLSAGGGSHAGTIVIENSAGDEEWATINLNGYPAGQTKIVDYCVPLGKTAYVYGITITTESNKPIDCMMWERNNVMQTSAPFSAIRQRQRFGGIEGVVSQPFQLPMKFDALTDFGFCAKVAAGSADVTVSTQILLINN